MIDWLIALGAFIPFWLLRAWYFHNKLTQTKKYHKIYQDYISEQPEGFNFSRHKPAIIELFKKANLKDFVVSKMEPAGYGMMKTFNIKGFDNIHYGDYEVTQNVLLKFQEAIGVFEQKRKESFSPFFWIESIVFLPKNMINYISPGSTEGGLTKVLQLIFWISMVLLGLHNAQMIDLKNWF